MIESLKTIPVVVLQDQRIFTDIELKNRRILQLHKI